MNKELLEIRKHLIERSEEESKKLFRMARKLEEHGGSKAIINEIRNEAFLLHRNAYPERLLDPFITWEYAFK